MTTMASANNNGDQQPPANAAVVAAIMSEYTIVDLQRHIAGGEQPPPMGDTAPHFLSAPPATPAPKSPNEMNTSNVSNATAEEDSTPSDSGVQLLDSVSSMNESLMSGSGLEFDLTPSMATAAAAAVVNSAAVCVGHPLESTTAPSATGAPQTPPEDDVVAGDFTSCTSNADTHATSAAAMSDEMKTSVCSTFDAEPIVYRRKTRKQRQHSASSAASTGAGTAATNAAAGPKKRVSFHEDILNSTKTDNIHIEHGFITYKGGSGGAGRRPQPPAGRYSWCPNGRAGGASGDDDAAVDTDDYEAENAQYYYRNACSDVLDYGKTDVYEQMPDALQADRSGVFEYGPVLSSVATNGNDVGDISSSAGQAHAGAGLYKCQCSDSNSSLSDDSSASATDQTNGNATATAQRNYGQAKSNSCDCIGSTQQQQQQINDNCYYSEPNIDWLNDNDDNNDTVDPNNGVQPRRPRKSVWSKELKPKSSCLKKCHRPQYQPTTIGDIDLQQTALKSFNRHRKAIATAAAETTTSPAAAIRTNIFGSLKQIFTMPLPERGVPEGCEDLNAVFECVPTEVQPISVPTGIDHCSPAHRIVPKPTSTTTPQQSPRSFLSKSFDGGLAKSGGGNGGGSGSGRRDPVPKTYVHNVDEQLRHNQSKKMASATTTSGGQHGSPQSSLTVSSAGTSLQSCSVSPTPTASSITTPVDVRKSKKTTGASSGTSTPANSPSTGFRNKYIVNCESTVFEHTGVSYEAEPPMPPSAQLRDYQTVPLPPLPTAAATEAPKSASRFAVPFRKKLAGLLRSFREPSEAIAVAAAGGQRPKSGQMPLGILPSPSGNGYVQADEIEQPDELVPHSDEDGDDAGDAQQLQVEFKMVTPVRMARAETSTATSELPPPEPNNVVVSDAPVAQSDVCVVVQYNVPMRMDTSVRSEISSDSSGSKSSATLHPRTAQQSSRHPAQQQVATDQLKSPNRSRHLHSPLHKKHSLQTNRHPSHHAARMSPDLFGCSAGAGKVQHVLSDEFDDILTITTTTASANDSTAVLSLQTAAYAGIETSSTVTGDAELVIIDYPDQTEFQQHQQQQKLHSTSKASSPMTTSTASSSKSSLINRFLRNVTQRKIADATIQANTQLAQAQQQHQQQQVRSERKLCDTLYVKGVRPRRAELIDDLNAEIAAEMAEQQQLKQQQQSASAQLSPVRSARTSPVHQHPTTTPPPPPPPLVDEFGLGVGEIAADRFATRPRLPIFRDARETLMKVFKLYTGYSLEGHMTPVLVFLTDQTLYVCDLVRSRLFNRFVLPYSELDVILIGPHGNTVLLSNSARDMQQVLLAGGPYPADGLVSSLEMCARRGGMLLPAVGQLTLDHLAPLQQFVREHSAVAKNDPWIYYAVVSVPANVLAATRDAEPLGPHIRGPLMFRQMAANNGGGAAAMAAHWQAGYFLLKAGVLYMFADAQHRIPSLVLGMYECRGARRADNATSAVGGRPHCFELVLRNGALMQLAAPDEYVASDWLQALVQAASGLFEMQDRHKALGCTMVLTSNHLITLREDFTAPLRRVNAAGSAASGGLMQAPPPASPRKLAMDRSMRKLSAAQANADAMMLFNDTASNLSSSTARFGSGSRRSSAISSPTRSDDGLLKRSPRHAQRDANENSGGGSTAPGERSTTSMSSIYGKNSGVEIKTCAALQEISSVRIPSHGDNWWCILEFSCQEVRECSDDMVVFFATNSDMRRFLTMLETLWQSKNDAVFPLSILGDEDAVGVHCSDLFMEINKSWDALISAALGYTQ